MSTLKYMTWNPQLHFELLQGGDLGLEDEFRQRTLKLTYTSRVRDFDQIEWVLDNRDGEMTQVRYLALGVMIRLRLGYRGAGTPWKTMLITRVTGGVGVRGRDHAAVGDGESTITYHGRNRNAPGPRTIRHNDGGYSGRRGGGGGNPYIHHKRTTSKGNAYHKRTTAGAGGRGRGRKTFAPTADITQWDMALARKKPGTFLKAGTTAEVVRSIAASNGFEGQYALIQDTYDSVDGLTVDVDKPDMLWLKSIASDLGYLCYIDELGFHFHAPNWSGLPKKAYQKAYNYGGPDILKLTIDGDYRLPVPTKVTTKGIKPETRTVWAISATGDIISFNVTGDTKFSAEQKKNISREYTMPVPEPGKIASAKAQQQFLTRHMKSFKINLELVGDPELLAGDTVTLTGTGTPFVDRDWFAEEVQQIFDGSTYTTKALLKVQAKAKLTKSKPDIEFWWGEDAEKKTVVSGNYSGGKQLDKVLPRSANTPSVMKTIGERKR